MGITVVRELHCWITFGPILSIFIFILKPASQPASQHPQPPLRGQALAADQQSKAFFFLASWPVLSKVGAGELQLLTCGSSSWLQALRVRKKRQPAPMRVLAAACRFLGRLLFLLGLSLRGRQPANRIFIVPDGAIQGVLSSGKHQPKRAQPSTGSHQRGLRPTRPQPAAETSSASAAPSASFSIRG